MKIGARTARLRALLIAACALVVFAACVLPARALWRGEHHEQRNELFQMEEKWRNAVLHGDAAAMASLLDDDYMAITSNGTLQSREQTLAHLRSGTIRFRSIAITDRKVRFYGNTAVVTCRADVVGATAEGEMTGSYRYTHVWVLGAKGNWRIVSFEANRIRDPQAKK